MHKKAIGGVDNYFRNSIVLQVQNLNDEIYKDHYKFLYNIYCTWPQKVDKFNKMLDFIILEIDKIIKCQDFNYNLFKAELNIEQLEDIVSNGRNLINNMSEHDKKLYYLDVDKKRLFFSKLSRINMIIYLTNNYFGVNYVWKKYSRN